MNPNLNTKAVFKVNPSGGQRHVTRILRDIRNFYDEKPSLMHISPDETDVCKVHALIIGPDGTPYHNGFFYFVFSFPTDYPMRPPAVKLITTGGGSVRFNPNLYNCGKVCLSILGTWPGPSWTPQYTLFSTMLSIQSLMNAEPFYNEPGFEGKHYKAASDQYSQRVRHDTARVAIVGMLENSPDARTMPQELKEAMASHFRTNYQSYEELIRNTDPSLLARLAKLK